MTWLKLDDNFPEHPKIAALPSDAVRWFHVRAMCYAARYSTRGEITAAAFRALAGKPAYAVALVDAGVWDTTLRGDWTIHDFEIYNPARDPAANGQLSRIRAESGSRGGKASAEAKRSKTAANGEASLLQANQAPSRPVPSPETLTPTGFSSLAEREIFDTALSKLPLKYQRDGLALDEMELFARDYAGKHTELANAIDECRRHNELCFAGNLRKYMPGGIKNGQHRNGTESNSQPGASQRDRLIELGIIKLD